jgi:CDP-diglyceride synthetase
MAFVVLVGCNDTFAYLTGVLFGKHPLAPKISPKKTIEGLIGSLIFTTLAGSPSAVPKLSPQVIYALWASADFQRD